MRPTRSLAGTWQFQPDPDGLLTVETVQPTGTIPVPMPWQSVFPELRHTSGYAWYRTTFEVDEAWLTGELLLHFGAVDYWCEIYINGECVGEHEGGYTPFAFPIRRFAQVGANMLTVRVYDSVQSSIEIPRWRDDVKANSASGAPPFRNEEVPHGKQTWYVDVSGIWQDVTLTAVPVRRLVSAHITPDIHTGEAHAAITLEGVGDEAATVRVTIAGQTVEAAIDADATAAAITVRIENPTLWTPDSPTLYTAVIELISGGQTDTIETRFGFRELTTRDGLLLLNGRPIYLLCALDQDIYPETIYTVPSDDFLRDQFTKAKALGLNSLRCHIKPPDPCYLDLADEMGLIIWAEIPSWRTFHPKTTIAPSAIHLGDEIKARARETLEAMIARDYNHPSLMIWTIVNEDWGTALLMSESDRAWVAAMVDHCKQLDPTRLVVDNSPCPAPWGLSVHVKSDLDDFHVYANIPDSLEYWERIIENFGMRPLWTYSNTGDAQRTGGEPLILSEFGNWGMPTLNPYQIEQNGEPDWFPLTAWWSPFEGEPGGAAGVLNRFTALGLDAIWPDYETFATATQEHQFAALRVEIEAMRRQTAIQGYVITELSDIYWESNGLLDFARGTKTFHDRFGFINAPDVIIPQMDRYAYWDDETARVRLTVSHYSDKSWEGARAEVITGTTPILTAPLDAMEPGSVSTIGAARWRFNTAEGAGTRHLRLHVTDKDGGRLAYNQAAVMVLPAASRRAAYSGSVAVITRETGYELDDASGGETSMSDETASIGASSNPAGDSTSFSPEGTRVGVTLRGGMSRLGYQAGGAIGADTTLVVAEHLTPDVLAWVRAGGDLLYINEHGAGSPFFWCQGRGGTYSGNWVTSWSWLRPSVHTRLPAQNPLTLPYAGIIPNAVILGLPMENAAIHEDILAGQIAGWLRHPAAHTVRFRYGAGRVIMTTYRLSSTISQHPIAAAMLHDLIDHLTSEACQPTLSANF